MNGGSAKVRGANTPTHHEKGLATLGMMALQLQLHFLDHRQPELQELSGWAARSLPCFSPSTPPRHLLSLSPRASIHVPLTLQLVSVIKRRLSCLSDLSFHVRKAFLEQLAGLIWPPGVECFKGRAGAPAHGSGQTLGEGAATGGGAP